MELYLEHKYPSNILLWYFRFMKAYKGDSNNGTISTKMKQNYY